MIAYGSAGFNAMGDTTRRVLVDLLLRQGAMSVVELSDQVSVSRPAVSQHLKILKEARLVTAKAEGTRRYYALDPEGFAAMRKYLESFWDEALEAFRAKAEEE